ETGHRFGGCAVLLPVRRLCVPVRPGGGQRPPAPVPGRPPGAGRLVRGGGFWPPGPLGDSQAAKNFWEALLPSGQMGGHPAGAFAARGGHPGPSWQKNRKKAEKTEKKDLKN